MTEKAIGELILQTFPMMFRNPVGYGIAASPKQIHRLKNGGFIIDKGAPIHYGLLVGSSDYIGWKPTIITPEMVGTQIAVFQSIEIKTEHDRLSQEQRKWNQAVMRDGGISEVWHYNGAAIEIIKGDRII